MGNFLPRFTKGKQRPWQGQEPEVTRQGSRLGFQFCPLHLLAVRPGSPCHRGRPVGASSHGPCRAHWLLCPDHTGEALSCLGTPLQRPAGHFHPGQPPSPPCKPGQPRCAAALPAAHLPRNAHSGPACLLCAPAEAVPRRGLPEGGVQAAPRGGTGPGQMRAEPQEVVCEPRSPARNLLAV